MSLSLRLFPLTLTFFKHFWIFWFYTIREKCVFDIYGRGFAGSDAQVVEKFRKLRLGLELGLSN